MSEFYYKRSICFLDKVFPFLKLTGGMLMYDVKMKTCCVLIFSTNYRK